MTKEAKALRDRATQIAGKRREQGIGDTTPINLVRWWVSYQTAVGMLENYSAKDWADVVEDGIKPMPKTWEGLWLEAREMVTAGDDVSNEEAVRMVIDSLDEFYI